ncbi:MAG: hypothetical protein QXK37_02880 [Candidatus Woesearchaeota archaeon]
MTFAAEYFREIKERTTDSGNLEYNPKKVLVVNGDLAQQPHYENLQERSGSFFILTYASTLELARKYMKDMHPDIVIVYSISDMGPREILEELAPLNGKATYLIQSSYGHVNVADLEGISVKETFKAEEGPFPVISRLESMLQ